MFPGGEWTPHKVEQTVWTYYILRDLKPEALENLPEASERRVATEAESGGEAANGNNGLNGEVSDGETHGEATEIVTPSPDVTPVTNTDTTPEAPEATNGTNGSEAAAEAVEAVSDKVTSSETEVGARSLLPSNIAFFFPLLSIGTQPTLPCISPLLFK